MKHLQAVHAFGALALIVLTACTDGAPGSTSGSGAAVPSTGVTTIDVSLTAFAATTISAGISAGYAPAQVSVPVGTRIRFINQDSFAHTASAVAGATFAPSSPLDANALTPSPSGRNISGGGWSSGNLAAGATSPVFVADAPGTYLFGCFYHYGAPMRGAIIVR